MFCKEAPCHFSSRASRPCTPFLPREISACKREHRDHEGFWLQGGRIGTAATQLANPPPNSTLLGSVKRECRRQSFHAQLLAPASDSEDNSKVGNGDWRLELRPRPSRVNQALKTPCIAQSRSSCQPHNSHAVRLLDLPDALQLFGGRFWLPGGQKETTSTRPASPPPFSALQYLAKRGDRRRSFCARLLGPASGLGDNSKVASATGLRQRSFRSEQAPQRPRIARR